MLARLSAVVLVLCAALPTASAAPIVSLSSTGLGAPGAADPHYALVSAPAGPVSASKLPGASGSGTPAFTTAYVVQQNANFPFDAFWASNNYSPPGAPASGWIAPTADVNTTHPDGYYTYRTTFDLTGFNLASASISGFVAADNGVQVLLNGQFAASIYGPNGYTFTTTAFANQGLSITSGFKPGINTLDFVVYNEVQASGNPTGLRVALSGNADPVPTPEPASLAVFGGGLIGLAGYIRRRRAIG